MTAPPTADVIIIGAGVLGASIALSLARRGYRTLNVDALPAAGYGSTSSSTAVIRPLYSTPEACALAHESRFRWRDWPQYVANAEKGGFARYVECGVLFLKTDENQALGPVRRALEDVGVEFDDLSADDVEARLPGLTMASFGPPRLHTDAAFGEPNGARLAGGLYCAQAGYVSDPQLAAENLKQEAEVHGAEFVFNARVTAVRRTGGRVRGVTLAGGETVDAPVVVNVAGPHSSKINALAGVADAMALTTRAMRHEVARTPAPPGSKFERAGCVLADTDTGVYLRPEVGAAMLIGSVDPACDPYDWVDPDDWNAGLTENWTRQVWRAALRYPDLPIPGQASGVAALYDVSDDWAPIYDRSDLDGFYMAVGTSGNQFKNAPVVGDLMAHLIDACEAGHDHDGDPLSFRLATVNRDISLRTYSRLRAKHPASSHSVLA